MLWRIESVIEFRGIEQLKDFDAAAKRLLAKTKPKTARLPEYKRVEYCRLIADHQLEQYLMLDPTIGFASMGEGGVRCYLICGRSNHANAVSQRTK